MKDTITLAELRQTELYRREQTRPLREFLMENIDVLKLADEFQNRKDWKLINYIHWAEQSETMLRQQQAEMDIVIKLLCGEQISDDLMAYWNPLHSTLKSKLLKAQEKC